MARVGQTGLRPANPLYVFLVNFFTANKPHSAGWAGQDCHIALKPKGSNCVPVRDRLSRINARKQFGVTIGSFQAIQHRAVEMLILSEEMTSLSSMAALTNDKFLSNKKPIYSSKINIGIGGRKLGQEAIQLHGGMGVTEEMEIGQYFKRLTLLDTFLGNADYYLKEYSKMEFN